jgi:hypothetical protein
MAGLVEDTGGLGLFEIIRYHRRPTLAMGWRPTGKFGGVGPSKFSAISYQLSVRLEGESTVSECAVVISVVSLQLSAGYQIHAESANASQQFALFLKADG